MHRFDGRSAARSVAARRLRVSTKPLRGTRFKVVGLTDDEKMSTRDGTVRLVKFSLSVPYYLLLPSYASLLSRTPVETALDAAAQASSRAAAFDLVDALSRSGALPLRHAALHVLVGAAHGFDASLMDTLTRDNINPIEKVERSLLIVASTLAGKPPAELVRGGHAARIAAHSPTLFAASEGAAASLTAPSTHVA